MMPALSPAPLVEGLVVAAVAAAGGASRSEVAAEARDALMGKSAHLAAPAAVVEAQPRPEEVVGVFIVENPHGLHARPAARLVSEMRTPRAHVVVISSLPTACRERRSSAVKKRPISSQTSLPPVRPLHRVRISPTSP